MSVPEQIWKTGESLGELAADTKIAYDSMSFFPAKYNLPPTVRHKFTNLTKLFKHGIVAFM